MGLDIYLYRYEDKALYDKQQAECDRLQIEVDHQVVKDIGYEKPFEQFCNDKEIWGERDYSGPLFGKEKYKIQPNKEIQEKYFSLLKERFRAAAAENGLESSGFYLEPNTELKECIVQPHSKYPDHYFKIGYFRSSYNSGGINSVLSTKGLGDLYYILNKDKDDYQFQPNWEECLERCIEIKNKYLEVSIADGGVYCYEVRNNSFTPAWESPVGFYRPNSKEQAMEVYRHQQKQPGDYDSWFGAFRFENPDTVIAIIPGKGFMNENTTYVVAKKKDDDTGVNDWYYKALEIVEDTIKYVLAQPDKEKYYLHWSG